MQTIPIVPANGHRIKEAGMELRHISPFDGSVWDGLLASLPGSSVFHSSAWARVLAKSYGHRPLYFGLFLSGKPVALVPLMEVRSLITGNRGLCLPFSDGCAPLTTTSGDVYPEIIRVMNALAKDRAWKHWEIRGGRKPHPAATPSATYCGHSLDLRPGSENLFAGLDPAVRRAVRKAEKSGLNAAVRTDHAAVRDYYALHVRTRRRHGLPPQSLSFFMNLHEELIRTDHGFVVMVSRGSQPLAGAVFLHHECHAVYKFGACDERFIDLRANNLAMWSAIRTLAERGFAALDFGRTSLSQTGLRQYKKSWGTLEFEIPYFRLVTRTGCWGHTSEKTSGPHNAVFSRLPSALNRFLGNILYPHMD